MKRVSIKRKNGSVIASRKLKKNEQLGYMELDILTKSEIPALFPVEYNKSFWGRKLVFHLPDLESLDNLLHTSMTFGAFAEIVLQIIEALQGCESYGIRCCNLELKSENIFYDRKTERIRMLYWPIITLDEQENLAQHFISYGQQFTEKGGAGTYGKKYLEFFVSRKPFALDSFKVHVENLLAQWKAE